MTDTRHDPARGSGAQEVTGPLGHLVVVFDNEIARALTAIAAATGWEITVLDSAPDRATMIRLGHVDALVVCNHDGEGAVELLPCAAEQGVPYVAMMASRNRSAGLLSDLRTQGVEEETLARLHLPAGLAIGGRGAGEIALSVMAEVVADRYGRSGGPMRDEQGRAAGQG